MISVPRFYVYMDVFKICFHVRYVGFIDYDYTRYFCMWKPDPTPSCLYDEIEQLILVEVNIRIVNYVIKNNVFI